MSKGAVGTGSPRERESGEKRSGDWGMESDRGRPAEADGAKAGAVTVTGAGAAGAAGAGGARSGRRTAAGGGGRGMLGAAAASSGRRAAPARRPRPRPHAPAA